MKTDYKVGDKVRVTEMYGSKARNRPPGTVLTVSAAIDGDVFVYEPDTSNFTTYYRAFEIEPVTFEQQLDSFDKAAVEILPVLREELKKPAHPAVPIGATISVLGYNFAVVVMEEDRLDGDSSLTDRCIRINSTRSPEVQVETFYHELVHMILQMTGYDSALKKRKEEAVAHVVGMGLASAILNNRNLPGMEKT